MSENTKQDRKKTITVGAVLGEAVWLMTQSKRHRHNFFLGDLEWLIMQPISEGQFRIFHNEGKPVAAAFWAFVSPEVEKRLEQGMSKLKLGEWRSGPQPWLIDLVAPFGGAEEIIKELQNTTLADYEFKSLQITPEGESRVVKYKGTNK